MINSKITTKQAIMAIVTIMVAHTILLIPSNILQTTSSASIINIIYITILLLPFVCYIYRTFKKFPGCDILDVCEFTFGKTAKKIFGAIFMVGFIITSGVLLRNFCECLRIVYYPMTDVFFVIIFFIIAVSITNKLSFTSTIKANLLIAPIVFISIIFLFVGNINQISLERIFPILGNGFFSTFVSGLTNIFCFSGIGLLYFMPPILKEPEKFKKICIHSLILSSVYLLITLAILIFLFPIFFHVSDIFPLFTAARFLEFGSFFQRLESVFLLIWIYVFACYISIVTKFSLLIFKKITNIKDYRYIIYPLSILLLSVSLIPKNQAVIYFYENTIYEYIIIGLVFVASFLILLAGNIKKKRKKVDATQ